MMKKNLKYIVVSLVVLLAVLGSVFSVEWALNLFIALVIVKLLLQICMYAGFEEFVKKLGENPKKKVAKLINLTGSKLSVTHYVLVLVALSIGGHWILFVLWMIAISLTLVLWNKLNDINSEG